MALVRQTVKVLHDCLPNMICTLRSNLRSRPLIDQGACRLLYHMSVTKKTFIAVHIPFA